MLPDADPIPIDWEDEHIHAEEATWNNPPWCEEPYEPWTDVDEILNGYWEQQWRTMYR